MSSNCLSPLARKSASSEFRDSRKSSVDLSGSVQFTSGCSLSVSMTGYNLSHFEGRLHVSHDFSSLRGTTTSFKLMKALMIDFDSIIDHRGPTQEKIALNSTHLRNLAKALKQAKNLKRLSLKSSKSQNLFGQKSFLHILSKMTNLQGLDVNIQGLNLANFAKSLKNLKFMKEINLASSTSSEFDMRRITSKLRFFRGLRTLAVDYTPNKLTSGKQIESLGLFLGRSKNLKTVDLNLSQCNQLARQGLDCFSRVFQKVAMRSLSLNFADCVSIDDVTFRAFSNYLRRAKQLNKLSLNFERCFKLKESSYSELQGALKTLPQLKDLTLLIEGDPLSTDQGVGNNTIKEFSIPHELCGLQSYTLKFSGFQNVFDSGFKGFVTSMSNLQRARSLSLNFEGCPKISDQGVKDLAAELKKLKSLNSLSLNFSRCRRITDISLIELSNSLAELTNLQKIDLNFGISWSQNNYITDNGLLELSKAIKNLTTLKELLLNFKCCFSLTDMSVKELVAAYEPLNLSYISLNLTSCASISEEGKQLLQDSILYQGQSILII